MMALPAFVISRVNALTPLDTMLSEETAAPTLRRAIVLFSGRPRCSSKMFWTVNALMSTTTGRNSGLAQDCSVVVDLVLLGRDEQQIHLPGVRPLSQHLVVDGHQFDVERNVLLRLPLDLLVQFGLGHHGDGDLADDDALPVDPDRHFALLDLGFLEDLRKRFGNGARRS